MIERQLITEPMPDQPTDKQLLDEYATHGDQQAFAQLVERRVDLVYSAAQRQVRDSHLAQDITQAVFVILARKVHAMANSRVHIAGWLLATTHWVALDALRKLARRRKHERKAAEMSPEASQTPDPSEENAWASLAPHLDAALARLREGDRAAIVLRYFEDKSMQEVAAELGVSEAAAKQRVFRAVEKLRKHVGDAALPAAVIGPAIAASAIKAAPAGLAHAATATALAASKAAGIAALVKGALWIMAINKLKASIIAVVILAITIPTAVVTYRAMTAQLPPVIAHVPPAQLPAPAATQPATVPTMTDWRSRFAQVYHLDEGQVLKRISPPFIPERQRYFVANNMNQWGNMQTGISVFQWDKNQADWNRWTGENPTVENILRTCARLPRYKIQMEDFDRMRTLEGDWVIRADASEADRMATIAEQIFLATEWPVKFEKQLIEREVFVARGKYKPTAPSPSPGEPPFILVYLDKHGQPSNRGVGNVANFLVALGEIMNTEIIDETGDSNRDGVYWSNFVSGGVAGPFREKMLKNVADQTGITFTPDKRKCDVWIATTGKP